MLISILLFSLCVPQYSLQRPHLAIAQGRVESGLNSKAVGKAGEKGAWQVIEKEWGKVPKDILSQAKQYERILDELVDEHKSLNQAVVRYNGTGKQARKYASKVRVQTLELLLLEP